MSRTEIGILDNLMCNISQAYITKDWQRLLSAYDTAKLERIWSGLPPFRGGPNLEDISEVPKHLVDKSKS